MVSAGKLKLNPPRFRALDFEPVTRAHEAFTNADEFDWQKLATDAQLHPSETILRARRSFILRANDEQRSLLAFSELLKELCEEGCAIDMIGCLARVVRDEAHHVDLCHQVVKAFGGWEKKIPDPSWVRSDKKLPIRSRILKTIVGSLCIGEGISVGLIGGVRDNTTDAVTRQVMTRILRDESFHARLGWWWLDATGLTKREREFIQRYAGSVLRAASRSSRPHVRAFEKSFSPSPYGAMSARERERRFVEVVERHVLPDFKERGFDLQSVWQNLQKEREEELREYERSLKNCLT